MKQVSTKRTLSAVVVLLLACLVCFAFRPSRAMALPAYGTDSFEVTYLSSAYKSVGISIENPELIYVDVQILQNGKVVAEKDNHISYASFSVNLKKNTVYGYRIRMHDVDGYGDWTGQRYFSTCSSKGFQQKGKSRTVKMTVPKVAGASKVVVFMSTNEKTGFKKVGTYKKKKTLTMSKFQGKGFKKRKDYYYRIQVYGPNGKACDNYLKGNFRFY